MKHSGKAFGELRRMLYETMINPWRTDQPPLNKWVEVKRGQRGLYLAQARFEEDRYYWEDEEGQVFPHDFFDAWRPARLYDAKD